MPLREPFKTIDEMLGLLAAHIFATGFETYPWPIFIVVPRISGYAPEIKRAIRAAYPSAFNDLRTCRTRIGNMWLYIETPKGGLPSAASVLVHDEVQDKWMLKD
jgi:hypothetical protein